MMHYPVAEKGKFPSYRSFFADLTLEFLLSGPMSGRHQERAILAPATCFSRQGACPI
jgi:hypothetical protein